jgi:hypothetical protein
LANHAAEQMRTVNANEGASAIASPSLLNVPDQ